LGQLETEDLLDQEAIPESQEKLGQLDIQGIMDLLGPPELPDLWDRMDHKDLLVTMDSVAHQALLAK